MSLWWVQKDQLDPTQLDLVENLPLRENFLILGPAGSGKTNVLLRRAQFVRAMDMPNVLVLAFTRPLTEFIKTGCFDAQNREVFPPNCVMTVEAWLRRLYAQHGEELPESCSNLVEWKKQLAAGASGFQKRGRLPKYEAVFVDEAQDLLSEEVELLAEWSSVLFFVGDDRQKIYQAADGLETIKQFIPNSHTRLLPFHYRIAPEICRMADRIFIPHGGEGLEMTSHYKGPRPGTIAMNGPLERNIQLKKAKEILKDQVRVYADLIKQGDRLGVIVARTEDRDAVFNYLQEDPALEGMSKIIRSRGENDQSYDPSFEADVPICILTVQGCKGLEFRAVHWLFSEELSWHHTNEHYYTVVTRAKTRLDIYYRNALPEILARAYSQKPENLW